MMRGTWDAGRRNHGIAGRHKDNGRQPLHSLVRIAARRLETSGIRLPVASALPRLS